MNYILIKQAVTSEKKKCLKLNTLFIKFIVNSGTIVIMQANTEVLYVVYLI